MASVSRPKRSNAKKKKFGTGLKSHHHPQYVGYKVHGKIEEAQDLVACYDLGVINELKGIIIDEINNE
jgi:hypothetical protein